MLIDADADADADAEREEDDEYINNTCPESI